MTLDPIYNNYAQVLIRDFGTSVDVFLRASKTKGINYNPKYEAGYVITNQNPITIKAYLRDKSEDSLIINQMGLVAVGAKELIIKENDASYFLLAEKVKINDETYEVYSKATGNKFQCYDLGFGYKAVILFKAGN